MQVQYGYQRSPYGTDNKTYCFERVEGEFLKKVFLEYLEKDYAEISLKIGETQCHPKDKFVKKTGREIALQRLAPEVLAIQEIIIEDIRIVFRLENPKYGILLSVLKDFSGFSRILSFGSKCESNY